jgi:Tfp pilus assembly protein PilN
MRFGLEGVDMSAGLNLLHYPTLDRQQRLQRLGRAAVLGVAAGAVVTGAALWVMAWQTDSVNAQKKGLQTQLDQRQRQGLARQQRLAQNQQVQQVLTQLKLLQTHQLAWTQLQNGLLDVLPPQGHRLQRLQVETGRIDVQGLAPDAPSIGRASQPLSERWGVPVLLQSLEADASVAQGVTFAWQAHWPALVDGALPTGRAKP